MAATQAVLISALLAMLILLIVLVTIGASVVKSISDATGGGDGE